MAAIKVRPVSRFVWPGTTAGFSVHVEGADVSTVRVRPCGEAQAAGFQPRFGGAEREAAAIGGELVLEIEVPPRAPFA